ERLTELTARYPNIRGISAAANRGVRELTYAIAAALAAAPPIAPARAEPALIELVPADAFVLRRGSDGAFELSGERVERLAAMTNFDSDESLVRFERALGKMGVEKKLREMGAVEGDTVRIGQYEFTYS
ncbi:MAG TPA: Obg family GTPase CgtA, partial [Candidatus Tumulicola sp.]|nr:Obg family GTPase CgtA [Candidatus Tumulicola sp.]